MTEQTPPSPRVSIEPATCIGSGSCVRLAPASFAMGDDGVARVTDPGSDELERLRLAERSCPTGAIIINES